MEENTIAELFARDPFKLQSADIDQMIAFYIEARKTFVLTGKAPKEAKPVDLKELGLI